MTANRNRETRIAENIERLRARIDVAAKKSGRATSDITLVAVTKYVGLDDTKAVIAAGCHHLGESRPQSLWEKAIAIESPDIQWHLIGHLQRNKVRRTLPHVALIHSVESERLWRRCQGWPRTGRCASTARPMRNAFPCHGCGPDGDVRFGK